MKEEKVIKSLKITSIAFGLILGLLSIFLVLNESFALFTSKTDKVIYSVETRKIPMLISGSSFQTTLRDAGYKDKITEVVFEANKDLDTVDTSIDSFDLSAKQNGSIMGYMTEDETVPDMYILHIVVDSDKIYANLYSSFLFSGNNITYYSFVFSNLKEIKNIEMLDTSKVEYMDWMFNNCSSLISLDVTHFNTSNVISMNSMFGGCSSLTSLDVTHFDTSNVTNMSIMFSGCSSLTSLDVTHFDTGNVTNMSSMFSGCSSLTSLDVTHFNTSNVTDMSSMFSGCSSLTSLDVTHFNTSNVTTMNNMFISCSSLTSLDVTHFNTSNVENMSRMFNSCSALTSLDLSNFDTSNVVGSSADTVTGITLMFANCTGLTEIRLDNAEFGQVQAYSDAFYGISFATLHIYLKDTQTNRDFMSTNFSSYTNITWV